jgi:hypothetical protein
VIGGAAKIFALHLAKLMHNRLPEILDVIKVQGEKLLEQLSSTISSISHLRRKRASLLPRMMRMRMRKMISLRSISTTLRVIY